MGFIYRKRINVGKGLGVTLSSTGMSASYRTRMGSVSLSGYSFRTGIPGLTFRSTWGRSKIGLIILLAIGIATIVYVIFYNLLAVSWYLLTWLYRRITVKKF